MTRGTNLKGTVGRSSLRDSRLSDDGRMLLPEAQSGKNCAKMRVVKNTGPKTGEAPYKRVGGAVTIL